jgi:UDP-N-acetylglucosamine--dolichyl-phosphate N-acetylglucosaminephosphotransferase
LDVAQYAIMFLASLLLPFVIVFTVMPSYISLLKRKGRVVDDVHKQQATKVPSPAGPVLFLAFAIGEAVLYLATHSLVPVVLLSVGLITFLIGLVDDLFVLGGRTKPLLLMLGSLPIVVAGILSTDVYTPRLFFPLFGSTGEHFTIYTLLIILSIPVVANAFNMMDSFNGEISSFTLITAVTLSVNVAIKAVFLAGYSLEHVAFSLPLVAIAASFYLFNKYPSKIFDGDSGSLLFGSVFASLAVVEGVELSAVVSIIPAILNSFYIISSLRGFVERRKVSYRPTHLGKDGLLYPSTEVKAPITLVRMILLNSPMEEKEIVSYIVKLTIFSCGLSILTAILTWVF